jgi:two-component system, OmpR family, sensor histidine kinase QseC
MSTAGPLPLRSRGLLSRHLWNWVVGVLLVAWVTLVAVAGYGGHHEAVEITDGQLVAVARLWESATLAPEGPAAAPHDPAGLHAYVQDVAVIEWRDGQRVADTHELAPRLGWVDAPPPVGLRDVVEPGPAGTTLWRVYVVEAAPPAAPVRHIAVLQDTARRVNLGRDLALRMTRPALLVLPVAALLLWWAIRRGLRPLHQLSQEVAELDDRHARHLDSEGRHREFGSIVTAINRLVDSLQTRAEREREFASDVAHELRTPLTGLALQAGAARHEPSADRLAQIEQEALRAGGILAQLLALARAQRIDEQQPADCQLGEVAADQVARYSPVAHETGHEIELLQPAEVVRVEVPPLLVELALRNLLENAVRHTPTGTHIRVEVWVRPGAVGLSVSDDGARGAGAPPSHVGAGLGLGLRLVARVADQTGGSFAREPAAAPMTTCFTLRWPR